MESLISEAETLAGRGDFSAALDKYSALEKMSRESDDKRTLEFSLRNEGWILLHKLEELDAAFVKYQESEKLCLGLHATTSLKLSLHDQAYILARKGTQAEALWKYRQFLNISTGILK